MGNIKLPQHITVIASHEEGKDVILAYHWVLKTIGCSKYVIDPKSRDNINAPTCVIINNPKDDTCLEWLNNDNVLHLILIFVHTPVCTLDWNTLQYNALVINPHLPFVTRSKEEGVGEKINTYYVYGSNAALMIRMLGVEDWMKSRKVLCEKITSDHTGVLTHSHQSKLCVVKTSEAVNYLVMKEEIEVKETGDRLDVIPKIGWEPSMLGWPKERVDVEREITDMLGCLITISEEERWATFAIRHCKIIGCLNKLNMFNHEQFAASYLNVLTQFSLLAFGYEHPILTDVKRQVEELEHKYPLQQDNLVVLMKEIF